MQWDGSDDQTLDRKKTLIIPVIWNNNWADTWLLLLLMLISPYKQWLKGAHNQEAGSLSRYAVSITPETHRNFLRCAVPQQLSPNFHIKPISKEISRFITFREGAFSKGNYTNLVEGTVSTTLAHMWHRPSGQITGMAPDWTMIKRLAISCKNIIEDTTIKTKPKRNRKQFQ